LATDSKLNKRRSRTLVWAVWLGALLLVTSALLAFREDLDRAHVGLIYLLLVLGAAATAGFGAGLLTALLTFLSFNFFFLLPYHTLTIHDRLDWLVLGTYLITASVAAALLTRAEREARARIALAREAEHASALREIDRLKDAVLAAVSHDLRTPLTNIRALAYELAAEGDERATIIGTEAERLNHYVASLLDLSALNSGALRIHLEVNTIEDVVGATLAHMGQSLNGRTVQTRIGEGAVMLARFDFVYTVRILTNLLENAHKYSPPGTPIEIGARRVGDVVEVTVSDQGSGVPATERERIFEPFYRHPEGPPDAGGAGLGLAIAQRLAQAQGGALRLEPAVSSGSSFTLTLPAAELPNIDSFTPVS
jgi:two-component system sensor histidine kinase KdpD